MEAPEGPSLLRYLLDAWPNDIIHQVIKRIAIIKGYYLLEKRGSLLTEFCECMRHPLSYPANIISFTI